jgi:DNA polymerase-3 subunit delta
MKYSEFLEFHPKEADNVFVFVCDDDFLIEESRVIWTRSFKGTWLPEKIHIKEFEGIEMAQLVEEARTPSLFAESRVLFVMNSEKMSKGRIEEMSSLRGISNSSLKVVLLFSNLRPTDDWIRKFPLVVIDSLKPADATRWAMERYGIASEVARYLVENVGIDLFTLHNEIEKLKTYAGPERKVTIRDVDELVLRSESYSSFELDDAIFARNHRKAIQVASVMLADGVEALQLLGRVLRIWRQIFIGKGLVSRRSAKEVAAGAGLPPFKAVEFAAGCRKYEWKEIASGFRVLLQLDQALKSSNPDAEASFEVMLWKLTR